jgi:hypothetical protein
MCSLTLIRVAFYFRLLIVVYFFCYHGLLKSQDLENNNKKQFPDTSRKEHQFSAGINLNQAAFSENWKGGGVNSFAVSLYLNDKFSYTRSRFNLVSDLQTAYGVQQNKGELLRKNQDRLFYDFRAGFSVTQHWILFLSVNFQSQFDAGYVFEKDSLGGDVRRTISRFMSPAFVSQMIGIEYKPVNYFYIRLGAATLRQTFVLDTTLYRSVGNSNYGVDIGKRLRNEVAFTLIADYDHEIVKNLLLKTRFTAFANYQTLDAIDIRWDINLIAKTTNLLNVNLQATLLHDNDQDTKVQWSQALAIGLSYKFKKIK